MVRRMDPLITKEFLDKARAHIKKHPAYAEDDPLWNVYDGGKDPDRCKSTLLMKIFREINIDPYDDNDYGDLPE